jgi:putative tryptophan/tyrosine transport system substrate-binding protein
VKRREFITLLGGTIVAWPLAARGQQPRLPVIGYLGYTLYPPSPNSLYGGAFLQGLAQAGYVPGRNLTIEFRGANFNDSVLPRLAADLVARKVDVIVTLGSPYAAVAAKAATSTIPIVFMLDEDPFDYGLVASFNRPGGNVTGVTFLTADLMGKRLNLLLELVPQATTVGYLCPASRAAIVEARKNDMLAAGHALGREILVLEVRREDFETAFATAIERRVGALIVGNYTLFGGVVSNRNKILELAARHKIPAMYTDRRYSRNGGLMSYGVNITEQGRNAGLYTARILKGEKPADLPVMQPTKFELVINLKTAKSLGLDVPPSLLALADEVIE